MFLWMAVPDKGTSCTHRGTGRKLSPSCRSAELICSAKETAPAPAKALLPKTGRSAPSKILEESILIKIQDATRTGRRYYREDKDKRYCQQETKAEGCVSICHWLLGCSSRGRAWCQHTLGPPAQPHTNVAPQASTQHLQPALNY